MPVLIHDDLRVLAERLKGSKLDLDEALSAHGVDRCYMCCIWRPTNEFDSTTADYCPDCVAANEAEGP